jgi:prephenate dehydrogenase
MTAAAMPGSVHIIGTGLIGTSIGLALRRAGVDVTLEDPRADHLQGAVAAGAGLAWDGSVSPVLVVVAAPPRPTGEVIADATRRFPGVAVTDVASIKSVVLQDAREAGADMSHVVGGHPMAGRETSGPSGARADLLDDRLWVITPTTEVDTEAVRMVHRLITACGAYPVEMTPQEHDRAVALVSHLPQVLASSLAAQLVEARSEDVRIAGQGLRDMTRIAGSNVPMWSDIIAGNAGPIAETLAAVVAELQITQSLLADLERAPSDPRAIDGIEGLLARGGRGRESIPGKHGAQAAQYAVVSVMIEDKPGQLGRLFVVAGDAGVNLEDVRIEHVLGRPSGLVDLFVQPADAGRLTEALRGQGVDVRA